MTAKRSNGEGTFTARPGGRWQYRVTVNGQRVVASGRTRTEAKRAAIAKAKVVGERRATDTLASILELWTERGAHDAGLRPTTFDQYRYLLGARVVPTLGDVRLDALTKRKVAELFDAMAGSPSTKRSTYAALVKLLDFAIDRGQLGHNVARDVRRPAAVAGDERTVDAEGARALLAAAEGTPDADPPIPRDRWAVAAWLAFGCGLRRGELLALRWADIDAATATLTVTGNFTRSSAGLVRGAPKTRRGSRQVPIPAVVAQQLQAHRRAQAAERLAAVHWEDSDLVLTNEIGGPVEPRSLSRAWQRWAAAAGLTDTGTHLGRHFAATSLLASGQASVVDVAAMLGHDPAVLLNTYASAVASGQRAAANVLGGALAAPTSAPTGAQNGATSVDEGGRREHESSTNTALGGLR